jgi:CelD/BcsL family acetyltransferase involved in cellulose biosynthesis
MIEVDVDDARWLDLISRSSAAVAFHHPAWSRALAQCYGYRPFVLAHAGSDGRLRIGTPIIEIGRLLGRPRWIALPFTDHCPPVSGDAEPLEGFIRALDTERRARRVATIELRSELRGVGAVLAPHGVRHTMRLDRDPTTIYQRFSKSQVQRNIRRGERERLTVREGDSLADLKETYYALHVETRKRQGIPVQPRRFFDALWSEVMEPGLGFVVLAYSGRVAVAGAVFLRWNGTVTYKYGASKPEAWRLRPNHVVFWHAIRWSCENGFHTFDWGRSDSENHGLRAFKSSWGATEEPLNYSNLGHVRQGRWVAEAQRLAAPVIRRSPSWVCRGIGEAFYKLGA